MFLLWREAASERGGGGVSAVANRKARGVCACKHVSAVGARVREMGLLRGYRSMFDGIRGLRKDSKEWGGCRLSSWRGSSGHHVRFSGRGGVAKLLLLKTYPQGKRITAL